MTDGSPTHWGHDDQHTDGDPAEAMTGVTESELAGIVSSAERVADGTAYLQIQSTRPHSLGYGLDDSPLGLAGWILEKFHAWCDIARECRAERRYNLVHYSVQDRGRHFAAFEQPELFAADVNTYGDTLRNLGVF